MNLVSMLYLNVEILCIRLCTYTFTSILLKHSLCHGQMITVTVYSSCVHVVHICPACMFYS